MADGVGELLPYHKHGYASGGNKKPDPNSDRSKAKTEAIQKGRIKAGPTNNSKGGEERGWKSTFSRRNFLSDFSR